MIFLLQHIINERILVSFGKTSQYGQCLSTVVSLALILRRAISNTCPKTLVEVRFHLLHDGRNHLYIGFLLKNLCKLTFALQSQIIPGIQQQIQVDVITPITPRPIAFSSYDQAIFIQLPNIVQITLHTVVHRRNKTSIATIEIIGAETVITHRSQHLCRKLITPITGRAWREDNTVFALPSHQFMDTLIGQFMSFQICSIKSLAQFVHLIAPPLRAFTVGTIHVCITHGYIKCADCFFTQAVQEIIIASKGSGKRSIISGFAILQRINLDIFRHQIDNLMTIHPSQ